MASLRDPNSSALSAPNVESVAGNESLAEKKDSRLDSRLNIRVISYRKRKHDPDGISIKAALDGLVRSGLLSDDSTTEIKKVTLESVVITAREDERTIIEIYESD